MAERDQLNGQDTQDGLPSAEDLDRVADEQELKVASGPEPEPDTSDAPLYTIDRDQPLRRAPLPDITSQVGEPNRMQEDENDRRMLEGAANIGELRLRVDLRSYIRPAVYTPMLGESMTIVCRNLAAAQFVREELRKFVASLDGIILEQEKGGAA